MFYMGKKTQYSNIVIDFVLKFKKFIYFLFVKLNSTETDKEVRIHNYRFGFSIYCSFEHVFLFSKNVGV